MGSTPVAFSCVRPHPRLFFFDSQAFEVLKACAESFPSFPCHHPYAASNPSSSLWSKFWRLPAEVIYHPLMTWFSRAFRVKIPSHYCVCGLSILSLNFLHALGVYPKPSLPFVSVEAVPQVLTSLKYAPVSSPGHLRNSSLRVGEYVVMCVCCFPAFAENQHIVRISVQSGALVSPIHGHTHSA